MSVLLLFLIGAIATFAFTPSSQTGLAKIGGRMQVSHPTTVYLVRNPVFGTAPIVADSSAVGVDGRFQVVTSPDSSLSYGLMVEGTYYNLLCLTGADSIELELSPETGSTILFDKLGATKLADSLWHTMQYTNKYELLPKYDEYEHHLAQIRDSVMAIFQALSSRSPHHLYYLRYYRTLCKYYYAERLCHYQYRHAWDYQFKRVDTVASHFVFLSVRVDSTDCPEALSAFATSYFNFVRQLQVDTILPHPTVRDRFRLAFDLQKPMQFPAVLFELGIAATYEDVDTMRQIVPAIRARLVREGYLQSQLEQFDNIASVLNRRLLAGMSAPNVTLPDQFGVPHSLAQYSGNVIYLDFWGTWCIPCREQLPHLQRLAERYSDSTRLSFVSIALEADSGQTWRKYLAQHHLPGNHMLALGEWENPLVKAAGITAVPRFMIIGRDGIVLDPDAPPPSSSSLPAILDSLLQSRD